MRRIKALSVSVGLVAAFVMCGRFYQANVAGQRGQRGQQPARSSSPPVYVGWPLPATGKAYGTIEGKPLMTDVAKLSVPLVVDVGQGPNWERAH